MLFGTSALDWSYAAVPSQAGKVVLITGGNTGLGRALAEDFLNPECLPLENQPSKVIITCRDTSKVADAIAQSSILRPHHGDASSGKLEVLKMDLADQAQVRAAVAELKGRVSKLDCLVLNAGCYGENGLTTKDGLEVCIGVCHFGHFLLTKLVWDLLLKADGHARVVPVSSSGHGLVKIKSGQEMLDDLNWRTRPYDPYEAYSEAKLANILFAKELARRAGSSGKSAKELEGGSRTAVTVVTLSPGFAATGLLRNQGCFMPWLLARLGEAPETMSRNSMHAATDLSLSSGCYLTPKRMTLYGPPIVADTTKMACDEELAKKLWAETESVLGEQFEP
mmetsp:Transcript_33839/g.105094  ORF Transcript_33839/g.105094 Transcript_33839/m.105094 type:complete len:337 (+) Transcript_33839:78-1088(+)